MSNIDITPDASCDVANLRYIFSTKGINLIINSIVKEVLAERGSKRILVIDAGNINHASMIGDQIASNAAKNEWVGIIVNGYVRDVEILKDIQIGILAKGSVPRKTVKRGLGSRSIDVLFDSVSISPGDWIYADSNGWIVSDKELIF